MRLGHSHPTTNLASNQLYGWELDVYTPWILYQGRISWLVYHMGVMADLFSRLCFRRLTKEGECWCQTARAGIFSWTVHWPRSTQTIRLVKQSARWSTSWRWDFKAELSVAQRSSGLIRIKVQTVWTWVRNPLVLQTDRNSWHFSICKTWQEVTLPHRPDWRFWTSHKIRKFYSISHPDWWFLRLS